MCLAVLKLIQFLLRPLAWVYGLVILIRNFAYDRAWIRSHKLPVPVISVGNLTAGGTGKTPIVIFLAEWYLSRKRRVGILSRGYGRKSKDPQIVVPGRQKVTPEDVGDEPFLMLRALKEVGLAVDKRRERGGEQLLTQMPVDVFLLDDGFQYRRLKKDLEIVVLDARKPFDNGWLIPAGFLREPPTALKRASLIWLTRVNQANNLAEKIRLIRCFSQKPIVQSVHAPVRFCALNGKEKLPLEALSGVEAIAFCAIGQPEAFRKDLENLGVRLKAFRAFGDHHRYTVQDVEELKNLAQGKNVKYILCTEKDAVKIPNADARFWFLKISIQIVANRQILLDLLPNLP